MDTENNGLAGLIRDDTFLCYACLDRKDLVHISPDPRYCKMCCVFLEGEARQLPVGRWTSWVPSTIREKETPAGRPSGVLADPGPASTESKGLGQKSPKHLDSGVVAPPLLSHHGGGRGRARKSVPLADILRLSGEGLSARQIACSLGNGLSYRSVLRTLSRQKVLLQK